MYSKERPFDRSGFASLDDLDALPWQHIYSKLENYQQRFLDNEDKFRSPSYIWPSAPLQKWSRVWEYPYVAYHVDRWQATNLLTKNLSIVDLGSGVTFFPLWLASEGYQVSAVDNDPIGIRDYPLACSALNVPQENLKFHLSDANNLPFDDNSVDCVFSISVLEHIPKPHSVIDEIFRVLKPNGLFILTIDVSLDGVHEITSGPFLDLQEALVRHFSPVFPESCVHPMRILTTLNSPFPYLFSKLDPIRSFARIIRRYARGMPTDCPRRLACYGFVGYPREA